MALNQSNPILVGLAIVGAIALILLFGSWILHGSMMGGAMTGGMMGPGTGYWLFALLGLAAIVAALAVLARRRT